MSPIVDDKRIGVIGTDGIVKRYPTHFAIGGGVWNRASNPTPSTMYFGKDSNYFCVLPVRIIQLPDIVLEEFLDLIGENPNNTITEVPAEVVAATVASVEHVVEADQSVVTNNKNKKGQ